MSTTSFFKTSGTSATTESTIQTQVNAASTSATNAAASRPLPQHHSLQRPRLHRRRLRSPISLTPSPQPRRLAQKAQTQRSPTTQPTTASTTPFLAEIPARPALQEPPGTAATIAVGTVTTGSPGTSATVTNSGTSGATTFDFSIPRGDVGATGATEPQRPSL